MPPSPLSLLWPTMLMPKKLYFSVKVEKSRRALSKSGISWKSRRLKEETPGNYRPMLRVTVMMFSDIVESVMLLKEEACNQTPYI